MAPQPETRARQKWVEEMKRQNAAIMEDKLWGNQNQIGLPDNIFTIGPVITLAEFKVKAPRTCGQVITALRKGRQRNLFLKWGVRRAPAFAIFRQSKDSDLWTYCSAAEAVEDETDSEELIWGELNLMVHMFLRDVIGDFARV